MKKAKDKYGQDIYIGDYVLIKEQLFYVEDIQDSVLYLIEVYSPIIDPVRRQIHSNLVEVYD